MFTGLIEKVAIVKNLVNLQNGAKISFEYQNPDVKIGESIALNGVCLTVVKIENNIMTADIMPETFSISNLKYLKKNDKINLERAMSASSRLDGHIVTGHVDTVAKVKSVINDGFSKRIEIETDTELIIKKGSIAVNGVSLTVSNLSDNAFEISLIPETLKSTNLGDLKSADIVNIEYDIIGKYIYKFTNQKEKFKITEQYLKENGF